MRLFIGIDPGTLGGLAAIKEDKTIYGLRKMPDNLTILYGWVSGFRNHEVYVALEKVSGYIGNPHPGSSMFEFGRGYGHIEMALTAIGLTPDTDRWCYTLPQRWQKGLGLKKREKGESDSSWKGYLKEQAAIMFPAVAPTLKTADALLIAEYCRRLHMEEL